jgi:hypothetical protein
VLAALDLIAYLTECGRAGYRIAAYGDGAYHYVKIESNVASFGALVGKYCGSLDEGHSACWDQYYAQWSYRNGGDYS